MSTGRFGGMGSEAQTQTRTYVGPTTEEVQARYEVDRTEAGRNGWSPVAQSWDTSQPQPTLVVIYGPAPRAAKAARSTPMRKATWAIVIWTSVVALPFLPFFPPATGDYQMERWTLAFLAGASLFVVWLIGFIPLSIIWFLSRPKQDVAVYGPQGQQLMVSEKEAKHWVETEGWAYQPPEDEAAAIDWLNARQWGPPPGGQPPYGGPPPQR